MEKIGYLKNYTPPHLNCYPIPPLCFPGARGGKEEAKRRIREETAVVVSFRGEATNHHSVFRESSQVWPCARTFLKKWGRCCYTFVSSVATEGVSPKANGRANPLTFSSGGDL